MLGLRWKLVAGEEENPPNVSVQLGIWGCSRRSKIASGRASRFTRGAGLLDDFVRVPRMPVAVKIEVL